MIDIIIPAYNMHDTIDKTLFSIAIQDIVDKLNVYIVNDYSDFDYSDQVKKFSKFMNIVELKLDKNRGPGFARQYGVDNSKSPFIMFIDADDMLYNHLSLFYLFNQISSSNYDLIVSNFVEEMDNDVLIHRNDNIFLHGKIYCRSFLVKNNICFNDSFYNEDNGFNSLLFLHNPRVLYLDLETYIWVNNKNSVTRRNDHEYYFKGLDGYLYNIEWALTKAIEHDCDYDAIASLAFACLVTDYYYYLEFRSDNLIKGLKKIYNYSKKYSLDDNKKNEIMLSQFDFLVSPSNKIFIINPFITFEEFLNRVEKYGSSNEL